MLVEPNLICCKYLLSVLSAEKGNTSLLGKNKNKKLKNMAIHDLRHGNITMCFTELFDQNLFFFFLIKM